MTAVKKGSDPFMTATHRPAKRTSQSAACGALTRPSRSDSRSRRWSSTRRCGSKRR